MTKKEILALENEALRIKAGKLFGRDIETEVRDEDELTKRLSEFPGVSISPTWDPANDIGVAMTDLFESVYGRGGKIKGGAWVLGTVDGGRDVASATLLWKAKSGQKHRANKVTVIRPRGEMAKAITQCWVCAMLGVSDD